MTTEISNAAAAGSSGSADILFGISKSVYWYFFFYSGNVVLKYDRTSCSSKAVPVSY